MPALSTMTVGVQSVAELTVDAAQVRGEGGALAPALVVPATLRLLPQVTEQPLAVVRLGATLAVATPPQPPRRLGTSAVALGIGGSAGLWQQLPDASPTRPVELPFALTAEHLRLLEMAAARAGRPDLLLHVELNPSIAVVEDTRPLTVARAGHIGGSALGQASLLRFCWESAATGITVQIGRDRWAEEVLPGLGVDRLRLIAVRLPGPDSVAGGELMQGFDRARVAFDAGRAREAIGHCRDIRHSIEQSLGATSADPVAQRVTALAGWPASDARTRYLDRSWQALADLTNQARHIDGDKLTIADARAALLHTAVLVEYLSTVVDPGGL